MKLLVTRAEAKKLISEDLLINLRPFGTKKKFYSVEKLLKIATREASALNSSDILSFHISVDAPFFDVLCNSAHPTSEEVLAAFLTVKKSYERTRIAVRVGEVSELLNCSPQSVYEWEKQGLIPQRFSIHEWKLADILHFVDTAGERKRYAKR